MASDSMQLGLSGAPSGQEIDRSDSQPTKVIFPLALKHQKAVEPLKLEVEESAESTNPQSMWQVYALGGFMVMSWFWGRWKERRTPSP
ncbi:uncharacterized protein LOC144711465 [Wolffia australiana]